MIALGVATSISKENQYSWQTTTEFAKNHNINSIQFYYPKNKSLPKIRNFPKFKNIYLHLPQDYDSRVEELIEFAIEFRKLYNSNKIIIHQKDNLSFESLKQIIKIFNQAGFIIGIENESEKDINSFYEVIVSLHRCGVDFFVVPDIHRFYYNYSNLNTDKEIYDSIIEILRFCNYSDIKIVLHVIDSISFKSNRNDWVALFDGIVPYKKLFKLLWQKHITVESLIFEYENFKYVINSLENLTNFNYYLANY